MLTATQSERERKAAAAKDKACEAAQAAMAKAEEASQLINKLKSDVESEKDQTRKYVDQKVRCIKNILYTLMNDKIDDLDSYFLEKFGTTSIFVNFGE